MLTDEAIDKVLLYDRLTFSPSSSDDDELKTWLRDHPEGWRADRTLEGDQADTQQRAILLTGEEGSGKTTELERIEAVVKAAPSGNTYHLDFSHAGAIFNSDLNRADRAIAKYVREKLETSARAAGDTIEFRASLYRQVLEQGAHTCLRKVQDENGPDQLAEMADAVLAGTARIQTAVSQYEVQCSAVDLAQHYLFAVQKFGGRTTFLLDNLDHLGVSKISKIVRLFSTSLEGNSRLVIALRTENAPAARRDLSHLRYVVSPYLDTDGAIWSIVGTRINGAEKFLLQMAAKNQKPPDALMSELVAQRKSKIALLNSNHAVSALVEQWYNGNIRQMLPAIVDVGTMLSPTMTSHAVYAVAHNRLIRQDMHPSLLEILDPRPIQQRMHPHPFVFLRLRLLSYLDKQDRHRRSVKDMQGDFRSAFGISSHYIQAALESLSERTGTSGALVRMTADHDQTFGNDLGDAILLPAGRFFIKQLVFSCDFLAWIYEQKQFDRRTMAAVERRPSDAEQKLEKACVVTERILLPAFAKEHPYIEKDSEATEADHARLIFYMRMFDYGVDQWFITKLATELTTYGKDRDLSSHRLQRVTGKVHGMVKRLNVLANSPFG